MKGDRKILPAGCEREQRRVFCRERSRKQRECRWLAVLGAKRPQYDDGSMCMQSKIQHNLSAEKHPPKDRVQDPLFR